MSIDRPENHNFMKSDVQWEWECFSWPSLYRYKLMGVTLQRCGLVLLLTSVPISCVWWNVEKVLLGIGQDAAIARIAKQYLRYLLPDLYATAVVTPLRIFLRSQCVTKPMMVCSGIALLLHVPINYVIVFWCRAGAPGTALANFFADLNLILLLYLYVRRSGICHSSWPGWSRACLVEWTPLLRLAIPSCLMTCLEWWCYEILMMLAGLLRNAHECVATMAIVINGDSILYALQVSI
jgi:MATE family multidrug resistance protein